jgi:uncharacterized protein YcfL
MKNYFILFLFLLFFFIACRPSGQEIKGNTQDQVVLKPFSDTLKADTFKIALTGRILKLRI